MSKLMKQRVAFCLSASVGASIVAPLQVQAETILRSTISFSDITTHWAKDSIQLLTDVGILTGYSDGTFRPSENITRAELATILQRVFGLYAPNSTSIYTDVSNDAWYKDAAMSVEGIMNMSGSQFRPSDNATREEVAYALVQAYRMHEIDNGTLRDIDSIFSDAQDVVSWAEEAIEILVTGGYLNGYPDGSFLPQGDITRAELVTILDRLTADFVVDAGTHSLGNVAGNVVINSADVILKDTTIYGNLYLGQGIADGSIWLDNVKVTGTIFIEGGGDSTVYLADCDLDTMIVDKYNEKILIVSQNSNVDINELFVKSGATFQGIFEINEATIESNNVIFKSTVPYKVIIPSSQTTVQINNYYITQNNLTSEGKVDFSNADKVIDFGGSSGGSSSGSNSGGNYDDQHDVVVQTVLLFADERAVLGEDVLLTHNGSSTWINRLNSLTINGNPVDMKLCTFVDNTIILDKSLFMASGEYEIIFRTSYGYSPATVTQSIRGGELLPMPEVDPNEGPLPLPMPEVTPEVDDDNDTETPAPPTTNPNPEVDDDLDEVDDLDLLKEILEAWLANVSSNLNSTDISTNGSDIYTKYDWVTQAVANALQTVINNAQKVFDNDSATADEIRAAIESLKDANTTFNDAKQKGTKDETLDNLLQDLKDVVNKGELSDLVDDAKDLLGGSSSSDDNGLDIPKNETWVDTDTYKDLEDAITNADNAIDNADKVINNPNSTESDIKDAIEELENALGKLEDAYNAFEDAIENGKSDAVVNNVVISNVTSTVSGDNVIVTITGKGITSNSIIVSANGLTLPSFTPDSAGTSATLSIPKTNLDHGINYQISVTENPYNGDENTSSSGSITIRRPAEATGLQVALSGNTYSGNTQFEGGSLIVKFAQPSAGDTITWNIGDYSGKYDITTAGIFQVILPNTADLVNDYAGENFTFTVTSSTGLVDTYTFAIPNSTGGTATPDPDPDPETDNTNHPFVATATIDHDGTLKASFDVPDGTDINDINFGDYSYTYYFANDKVSTVSAINSINIVYDQLINGVDISNYISKYGDHIKVEISHKDGHYDTLASNMVDYAPTPELSWSGTNLNLEFASDINLEEYTFEYRINSTGDNVEFTPTPNSYSITFGDLITAGDVVTISVNYNGDSVIVLEGSVTSSPYLALDTDDLKDLVSEAEDLLTKFEDDYSYIDDNDDKNTVSQDAYNNLKDIFDKVESALDDGSTTQDEIDALVKDLESAIEEFKNSIEVETNHPIVTNVTISSTGLLTAEFSKVVDEDEYDVSIHKLNDNDTVSSISTQFTSYQQLTGDGVLVTSQLTKVGDYYRIIITNDDDYEHYLDSEKVRQEIPKLTWDNTTLNVAFDSDSDMSVYDVTYSFNDESTNTLDLTNNKAEISFPDIVDGDTVTVYVSYKDGSHILYLDSKTTVTYPIDSVEVTLDDLLEDLKNAIADAKDELENLLIKDGDEYKDSTDNSVTPEDGDKWVTEDEYRELENAITNAENALNSTDKDTVSGAIKDLEDAFNDVGTEYVEPADFTVDITIDAAGNVRIDVIGDDIEEDDISYSVTLAGIEMECDKEDLNTLDKLEQLIKEENPLTITVTVGEGESATSQTITVTKPDTPEIVEDTITNYDPDLEYEITATDSDGKSVDVSIDSTAKITIDNETQGETYDIVVSIPTTSTSNSITLGTEEVKTEIYIPKDVSISSIGFSENDSGEIVLTIEGEWEDDDFKVEANNGKTLSINEFDVVGDVATSKNLITDLGLSQGDTVTVTIGNESATITMLNDLSELKINTPVAVGAKSITFTGVDIPEEYLKASTIVELTQFDVSRAVIRTITPKDITLNNGTYSINLEDELEEGNYEITISIKEPTDQDPSKYILLPNSVGTVLSTTEEFVVVNSELTLNDSMNADGRYGINVSLGVEDSSYDYYYVVNLVSKLASNTFSDEDKLTEGLKILDSGSVFLTFRDIPDVQVGDKITIVPIKEGILEAGLIEYGIENLTTTILDTDDIGIAAPQTHLDINVLTIQGYSEYLYVSTNENMSDPVLIDYMNLPNGNNALFSTSILDDTPQAFSSVYITKELNFLSNKELDWKAGTYYFAFADDNTGAGMCPPAKVTLEDSHVTLAEFNFDTSNANISINSQGITFEAYNREKGTWDDVVTVAAMYKSTDYMTLEYSTLLPAYEETNWEGSSVDETHYSKFELRLSIGDYVQKYEITEMWLPAEGEDAFSIKEID